MFEYLFIPYGINCDNKVLNYFFTGLTATTFITLVSTTIITVDSIPIAHIIITKLSIGICFGACLASYLFVKFKAETIFEIVSEIDFCYRVFQLRSSNVSAIVCVLAQLALYISLLISIFIAPDFDHMFHVRRILNLLINILLEKILPRNIL